MKSLLSSDYAAFLTDLKSRIVSARLGAARAVNRELILLYWDIGHGIVEKQRVANWGDAVVEQLAADLQREFPTMRGFSSDNIWRMRQFYAEYSDPVFLEQAVPELSTLPVFLEQPVPETCDNKRIKILSQAVRELAANLPWGHNLEILKKIVIPAARVYYLRATAQLGWSRAVLLNQIKAGAYERARLEKKTHNFQLALPEHFAEQSAEALKSRYNLEFLGIGREMKERELEDGLVARLTELSASGDGVAAESRCAVVRHGGKQPPVPC